MLGTASYNQNNLIKCDPVLQPPQNPLVSPDDFRGMVLNAMEGNTPPSRKMSMHEFDKEVGEILKLLMMPKEEDSTFQVHLCKSTKERLVRMSHDQHTRLLAIVNLFESGLRTWNLKHIFPIN